MSQAWRLLVGVSIDNTGNIDLSDGGDKTVLKVVSATLTPRQVIGGAFQDAAGNPLAGGYLFWKLNTDAVTSGNQQVVAGRTAVVPLDANGDVSGAVTIWPNSQLTPTNTVYFVTAYSAAGQVAWKRQVTIPPNAVFPFDLTGI